MIPSAPMKDMDRPNQRDTAQRQRQLHEARIAAEEARGRKDMVLRPSYGNELSAYVNADRLRGRRR